MIVTRIMIITIGVMIMMMIIIIAICTVLLLLLLYVIVLIMNILMMIIFTMWVISTIIIVISIIAWLFLLWLWLWWFWWSLWYLFLRCVFRNITEIGKLFLFCWILVDFPLVVFESMDEAMAHWVRWFPGLNMVIFHRYVKLPDGSFFAAFEWTFDVFFIFFQGIFGQELQRLAAQKTQKAWKDAIVWTFVKASWKCPGALGSAGVKKTHECYMGLSENRVYSQL